MLVSRDHVTCEPKMLVCLNKLIIYARCRSGKTFQFSLFILTDITHTQLETHISYFILGPETFFRFPRSPQQIKQVFCKFRTL